MTRKVRKEDQATIDLLRGRSLATINYVANVQDFPLAFMYRENIEKAASEGNLRKLRLMARDVDQMVIGLEPHQREGLRAVLDARFGSVGELERAAQRERIAHTLQRGNIASEKERRHLEDYAEMLEATGDDPAELSTIRRLLRGS